MKYAPVFAVYARLPFAWQTRDWLTKSVDGHDIDLMFSAISPQCDQYLAGEPPTHVPEDHIFVGYVDREVELPDVHWGDQRIQQIRKERGVLYARSEKLQEEADSLLAITHDISGD